MEIAGQDQGAIIAQFVLDVNSDIFALATGAQKVAYGVDTSSLVVVSAKQEYTVLLNAEIAGSVNAARQAIPTFTGAGANPVRTARIYVAGGDTPQMVRVQIVDFAGAAAQGAAGDLLSVSVIRVLVPTL